MVKRGKVALYNFEELMYIIKKKNQSLKLKNKLAIIPEEDRRIPRGFTDDYTVSAACMVLVNEEDDSIFGIYNRYIPIKGGNTLYSKYKSILTTMKKEDLKLF